MKAVKLIRYLVVFRDETTVEIVRNGQTLFRGKLSEDNHLDLRRELKNICEDDDLELVGFRVEAGTLRIHVV